MRNLFIMAFAVLFLSSAPALAGKAPKYNAFQTTYQYVLGQIGSNAAKKKKARSIMSKVRSGFKSMDRQAFYGLVAREEAKLIALTN